MKRAMSSATLTSIFSGALLTMSCGAFSTKNKGEKARENDSKLSGEWRNGCTKVDWLGFAYKQETLTFSAIGDFDKATSLYNEGSCTSALATLTEHGTYAALGNAKVEGAKDINFTVTEATLTAKTDESVNLFNGTSYCGINSWPKGKPTDVLDKPCAGVSHSKGEVIFDIYRVDSDGKRLLTGQGSLFVDKGDVNSRPEKLDESRAYSKK